MKRSLLIHSCWLLVTIGTFMAGSQWTRTVQSDYRPETVTAAGGGKRNGISSNSGTRYPAETRKVSLKDSTPPTNSRTSERRPPSLRGTASRNPASGLAGLSSASENGQPLNKDRIGSLVRQAIRGANPLERRQAFDRLLEAMQADSFTREQAMMMRSAMAENGASGELWSLFDYSWGANDPATALAHVDEIAEQYREGFLGNMIPGLASVDPQAAIDLFSGLEPDVQNKIRKRLLEGLIDNDIEVATSYIYDATDPKNFSWKPMDELTREIVKEQGLEPALEWAAGLPEGPLRGSAWSAAYAHWGAQDPLVAVQAIMEMPPSQDKNQAINGFISALAHQDGERAVVWAGEITQPGMREAAQLRAATQYFKQDPQGATEWFGTSGLPAEAWEQLTGTPWPAAVETGTKVEVQNKNS